MCDLLSMIKQEWTIPRGSSHGRQLRLTALNPKATERQLISSPPTTRVVTIGFEPTTDTSTWLAGACSVHLRPALPLYHLSYCLTHSTSMSFPSHTANGNLKIQSCAAMSFIAESQRLHLHSCPSIVSGWSCIFKTTFRTSESPPKWQTMTKLQACTCPWQEMRKIPWFQSEERPEVSEIPKPSCVTFWLHVGLCGENKLSWPQEDVSMKLLLRTGRYPRSSWCIRHRIMIAAIITLNTIIW